MATLVRQIVVEQSPAVLEKVRQYLIKWEHIDDECLSIEPDMGQYALVSRGVDNASRLTDLACAWIDGYFTR